MHTKHSQTQKREKYMTNMERKVLKDNSKVDILEAKVSIISIMKRYLSSSLEEAVEAVASSSISVMVVAMVSSNNNNQLKTYLRTQMSLSWT